MPGPARQHRGAILSSILVLGKQLKSE
jgi:hypothetical protein